MGFEGQAGPVPGDAARQEDAESELVGEAEGVLTGAVWQALALLSV